MRGAFTTFALLVLAAVATSRGEAQEFEWAVRRGGASGSYNYARGIAVDASGNVYTVGQGPASVVKLDSAGDLVWAGVEGANARDVAVDAGGNVYIAGTFGGTVDFDPGPGTSYMNSWEGEAFILKLDSADSFVWAKQLGGGEDPLLTLAEGVAADASGNVYTVGYFQGTADFDPGPGVYSLTGPGPCPYDCPADAFISKLDAAGNFVWAKQLGGESLDHALDVSVDASGNVHTVGDFQGTADFDPGPGIYNLTAVNVEDAFVSKLDTTGNFVWARRLGTVYGDIAYGVVLDASGNVYTAGRFGSTAFVSKTESAGRVAWTKNFGGLAFGVAVDVDANVYTVGDFWGTQDFDPGPGTYNLTATGYRDAFISKLDGGGDFAWAKKVGGTLGAEGRTIAVDDAGAIYLAGIFDGTADFDPGPGAYYLTAVSREDWFILKLAQLPMLKFSDKSTLTWNRLFGEAAYNVYRSDSAVPGMFVCLASNQADAFATDFEEPTMGAIYAYLVTAVNSAGQEGSMGFQAVNGNRTTERPNPNPCP